jgi:hypothetical protein
MLFATPSNATQGGTAIPEPMRSAVADRRLPSQYVLRSRPGTAPLAQRSYQPGAVSCRVARSRAIGGDDAINCRHRNAKIGP